MSSISHGSLTFLKKNLTTVILAVRSAQLENSRSGAYSQIPQNSKLEFPFPSRADFPSPTIWFCVLRGVLMYPVWSLAVHLPPISVSSFTAPWTASTSHSFPSSLPLPSPDTTSVQFLSNYSHRKENSHWIQMSLSVVAPAGNNHRRRTHHSTVERHGSKGNTSQLLRESRFWWDVSPPLQWEG